MSAMVIQLVMKVIRQKNVRHYTIEMNAGLTFNYAVDACWKMPVGSPPWTAPDDFGPKANRTEAWMASVTETENTLWNDGMANGGGISLSIDVYDWFDVELNSLRIESPGNFTMVVSAEDHLIGVPSIVAPRLSNANASNVSVSLMWM